MQYRNHFVAHEVKPKDLGSFDVIPIEDILGPPVTLIETARGQTMLRCKEYYKIIS